MCLEGSCAMAEKNCGTDCIAIEACIETTCRHLSELGSADEGVDHPRPPVEPVQVRLDLRARRHRVQCTPHGNRLQMHRLLL